MVLCFYRIDYSKHDQDLDLCAHVVHRAAARDENELLVISSSVFGSTGSEKSTAGHKIK